MFVGTEWVHKATKCLPLCCVYLASRMTWAICGVRIQTLVWRCWISEGGQSLELRGSSVEGGGVPRTRREKQANNGTFPSNVMTLKKNSLLIKNTKLTLLIWVLSVCPSKTNLPEGRLASSLRTVRPLHETLKVTYSTGPRTLISNCLGQKCLIIKNPSDFRKKCGQIELVIIMPHNMPSII